MRYRLQIQAEILVKTSICERSAKAEIMELIINGSISIEESADPVK